jgi:hypothetical protein
MQTHWVVLTVAAVLFNSPCFAGESATFSGRSDKYSVEFLNPLETPDSTIEISEYVQDDFGYTKKLPPVSFNSECAASKKAIRCKKNGKSPLAGAIYKRTLDGSPHCPGQAEYRFTCVSGCTSVVPRYIEISPWEC